MAVGIEPGLMIGILLSVINIFLKAARPKVMIYVDKVRIFLMVIFNLNFENIFTVILKFQSRENPHIYVRPSSGIFFPGIDNLRQQINIAMVKTDFKYPIIFDLVKISSIDYTSLRGLESIIKDLKNFNLIVKFINVDEKIQRRLSFN